MTILAELSNSATVRGSMNSSLDLRPLSISSTSRTALDRKDHQTRIPTVFRMRIRLSCTLEGSPSLAMASAMPIRNTERKIGLCMSAIKRSS